MNMSEFRKEDYWLIRWPVLSLTLSLCLVAGLLVSLNMIDGNAATELRRARSDLDGARERVGKIEEEEATIIEYLGRYRSMEQAGIVAEEDRLQFQENLQQIRDRFNLSPVDTIIEGQSALPLQYAAGSERGRPIFLNTSLVELSFPLLHEDDLARLLAALLEQPGMLQPLNCSLSVNSRTTDFIFLANHFNASCSLHWYHFTLPPAAAEDGR